jgi:hypothetical protein
MDFIGNSSFNNAADPHYCLGDGDNYAKKFPYRIKVFVNSRIHDLLWIFGTIYARAETFMR